MEQYLQVESHSNSFSSIERYLQVDSVLLPEYIVGNKLKLMLPEEEYFVQMMISKYSQDVLNTSTYDVNGKKWNGIVFHL